MPRRRLGDLSMSGAEGFHEEEGRYKRLRKIDEGGMGAVYLAEDVVLQRKVALKVLAHNVAGNREHAVRLAGEARAMAALESHPNIVQIFDVIMANNELCLVLEFVEGMNLRQLMTTPELTQETALKLLNESALALAYLHDQKSIVHRDIKPANILIRRRDGAIKLIDFGIARFESAPRLTQEGKYVGTPGYVAPEVTIGHPSTPASDIWSLGVVLREAMGQIRDRNPGIPFGALDTAILDMTEDDPSLRPRALALAHWDGVRPLAPSAAGPSTAPTRAVPFVQGLPKTVPIEHEQALSVSDNEESAERSAVGLVPRHAALPDADDRGAANKTAPSASSRDTGWRWPALAGGIAAVALAAWLISPAGLIHGRPGPLAAPSKTPSAAPALSPTSPAPSPSPTEPTPPFIAGPWSAAELNDRMASDIYKIGAAFSPGRNPFGITAAKTGALPLDPALQYVLDNQVLTADGSQDFVHLRLMANRGKVAFTPHLTTCAEAANAGKADLLPGVYMVVPTTDTSSTFAGIPVTISGKSYAILDAECATDATPWDVMQAEADGPAQELHLRYRLPVRPDGSWDRAALPSLGMFMKSAEGQIVMLEG